MNQIHSVLADLDLNPEQVSQVLDLAIDMKADPVKYGDAFKGKSIATIYEKPSLRTRVSFDVGINKLGGHAVYLDQQNGAMGKREDVADFGANLSCWVDAIVARVNDHQTLIELQQAANVPIVNSLCNLYHPCQALADYMSLKEKFGELKGLTLAYIGDGNNVTHSLLLTGAQLGVNLVVITPEGYTPNLDIVKQASEIAAKNNATVTMTHDISDINQVDAIYADTWISMGDGKTFADIAETFMPYQVTNELMTKLSAHYFMHCQPAHRGQEVTGDVLDSEQSIILRQAENRMWAQNALLHTLLIK